MNITNIVYSKGPYISPINFIKHRGPFHIFKEIRDGDKTVQEVEEYQKELKLRLDQITSGDPEHKDYYQKDAIENIKNLFNLRQKVINSFNDSVKLRSEAIYQSKQNKATGTGLKILTHKQMPQRLPVALAQVKAGNK